MLGPLSKPGDDCDGLRLGARSQDGAGVRDKRRSQRCEHREAWERRRRAGEVRAADSLRLATIGDRSRDRQDGVGNQSRCFLRSLGGRSSRNRGKGSKLDGGCAVLVIAAVLVPVVFVSAVVRLVAPSRLVTRRVTRLVGIVWAGRIAGDLVIAFALVASVVASVPVVGLVAPSRLVARGIARLVRVVRAWCVAGDLVVALAVAVTVAFPLAVVPLVAVVSVVAVVLVAPRVGVAGRVTRSARVVGARRVAVGVAVAQVAVVRRVEGLVRLPSARSVPALRRAPVRRGVPAAIADGAPALGWIPVAVPSLVPSRRRRAGNPVVSAVPTPLSDESQ